jgi:hypothetical protein
MSTALQNFIASKGLADLRDLVNKERLDTIRHARTLATDNVDIIFLDRVITNETESRELNTRLQRERRARDEQSRSSRTKR